MALPDPSITIEVVYGTAAQQCLLKVRVTPPVTIEHVIRASGILERFPEIDLSTQKVGIFSKVRALGDAVEDGDRIEIYRPLIIDPKEARRAKAARRHKKR